MGFDRERRYAAEYDQTPRDQTSVPKESVEHDCDSSLNNLVGT